MSTNVYEVTEKMHKISAKLYPNHLKGGEGTYLARNANEGTVTIEDICAAMKNRGGYDGSYEDALQTTKHFFKEMLYQLCDGFSVNTGYFTIRAHIGGVFRTVKETFDTKKHPVSFRFQTLKSMRDLRETIEVIIDGHIDDPAYITEFNDMEENSSNSIFMVGNVGEILGHRIKIEGPDSRVGLFIAPVDNPANAVKVSRVVENTASRVLFVFPQPAHTDNRLEIRTMYSGSGIKPLSELRVITSPFILQQA
jgi:hypothetical protein